jgi:integrase
MPRPKNPVPSYRLHKQSGQAIVTLNLNGARKDVLLGRYDTPESKQEYERILAQLRAAAAPALTPAGQTGSLPDLTVNEVLVAFMEHAERHYRHPDGRPTDEVYNFTLSLRTLRELYGHTLAAEFGPLALKTVRRRMIDLGWCRSQINIRVGRVRRVFKWAASEQLVPVAVYQALATVTGLQKGRSEAVESELVGPVPDEHVRATLPHLNRHVRGMVEFQRLTGCRPGEACRLRCCDIDTTGPTWVYRPVGHKTAWRGKDRAVVIGPKARELVEGFFTGDPTAYLFNPRQATAEHHAARSAARKTPRYPSHMKRNQEKRAATPRRRPALRYTLDAYGHAIDRACDRAGVPCWHPNQLRHSFATAVRERFGLEAAQVLLGHERADVTQMYAERNLSLAQKVAAEIG